MPVEIPPELVDEIVDAVTAVPGHGPTIQEIVRATAERLFALWVEGLTSDEAVEAACLNDAANSLCCPDAEAVDVYGAANRERLAAVATALSSVSGKDEA